MVSKRLIALFFTGLVLLLTVHVVQGQQPFTVYRVDIEGAVSPAQVELLDAAIEAAQDQGAGLLLIRLNTPGGLGQSMREMVQQILGSPLPVAVWVAPAGGRAASAGVFIVAAADVAAMSPQTSIGAASPVPMGGGGQEMDETMAAKIENDILSLVRGVAAARGRNVEWYERAVTEADSITASEAVMENVVDFLATDIPDLLQQIASRGLTFKDQPIEFDPAKVEVVTHEPGFRYKVLSWLLDPQIAYILLLGGIAGLFFELSNPGTFFPGVLGGISLLLGLYALSILPTNAAGFLLILLGLVLFVLEIKVVSFGLLSVGGLVCFFIGSLILFDFEYGMSGLPLSTIAGVSIGLALVVGAAVFLVIRAHRRRPEQGMQALIGQKAKVRTWSSGQGQVFVRGEVWSATASDAQEIEPGDLVEVTQVEGLTLTVHKVSG